MKKSDGRLILTSLVLSMFQIRSPGHVTSILLIDIGISKSSVGVIGQIWTFSSVIIVVSALLMGVLSVRFRHKSLLLAGLLFVVIDRSSSSGSPVLAWLGGLFAGVGQSALSSLTLEQVPRFRGTMMSTFSAAKSMGIALGAALGLMLFINDYYFLGISLGAVSILASIIFFLLTIDPTIM